MSSIEVRFGKTKESIMDQVKFNARPQSLTKLFEAMKILSENLIATILHQKTRREFSWHYVNQTIWDLQDLLVNFHGKIENLTLDELSCRAICSFENYTQKFVERKRIFISNAPHETKDDKYVEARERAENTAYLLKEIHKKLGKHFEQLIYEKIAAQKEKGA